MAETAVLIFLAGSKLELIGGGSVGGSFTWGANDRPYSENWAYAGFARDHFKTD